MKQSVWFVILTYRPDAEKLPFFIKNFDGLPFVLVDNSEEFNEFPAKINVIRTGENFGYTGGMNKGISYCLGKGADWVVVCNDDLQVTANQLKIFASMLQKTEEGVVGPFIGTFDKKRWTTIFPSVANSNFYISGSLMAIHRSVIKKIGYFYEPYFIYYEDVEFCVQAVKSGFKITQVPLKVYHKDATVFGNKSFLQEYYLARNHLLFVERNAPMSVKLHEFFRLPKTVWEHWRKEEHGALEGIRDYFLRCFEKYENRS